MRHNTPLPLLNTAACRITTVFSDESQSRMEWTQSYIASVGQQPISQSEMELLYTAYLQNMDAEWQACNVIGTSLVGVYIEDISAGQTPSLRSEPVTPPKGTITGGSYPSFVAVIAQKITAIKGQHGKGRIYLGAVPLSFINFVEDVNVLTPAAVTAYTALVGKLDDPLVLPGGRTWTPAVTTKPIAPAFLVTRGTPLVSFALDNEVGTSRRRKLGRGR